MKFLKLFLFVTLNSSLLLLSACNKAEPVVETAKPTPDVAAEQAKAASIAAAEADPLKGLVESFQKAAALTSYRVQTELTSNGKTSLVDSQYVAPDRYRVLSGPTEFIVIGGDAYMKVLGSWQKKNVAGLETQIKNIRSAEMLELVRQATNVKYMKADMLDGKPMLVYQYTVSNLMSIAGTTASRTWVGMTDGLPHKTEFESNLGEFQTKGVMTWSDYNSPKLTIEPPIKPPSGQPASQ